MGGTNDNTGLTHVGAREYDPALGRFVSVDPVMDLRDPQQWNAYAYSNNSPVTFSDPTGLWCDSCNNGSGWDQVDGMSTWASATSGPSAEQVRYSVLIGANTNPAFQPYIANVQVPTFEVLKQIRPAGYSYGPGDSYGDAVRDWAFNRCQRDGSANADFCAAARSFGLTEYRNPTFGKALAAAVVLVPMIIACAATICGAIALGAMEAGLPPVSAGGVVGVGGAGYGLSRLVSAEGQVGSGASKGSAALKGALKSCDSFTGDTRVLMADGSTKRIDEVVVGDVVANSEPESTAVESHDVIAVHVTDADKEYVDLTIATSDGPRTITTTAHHRFYGTVAQEWVRADSLKVGDELQTPGNGRAVIAASSKYATSLRTHNLTVDSVHTYYVVAGATQILVHNTGGCGMVIDPAQLQAKFKHAGDFGVSGNWSKANGAKFDEALKAHVNDPATMRIQGTYHGDNVIHHLNPSTGVNVMHTPGGEFVSGWKLNPAQLNHVLFRGSL